MQFLGSFSGCLGLCVLAAGLVGAAQAQNLREDLLKALGKLPRPKDASDFRAAPSLPCLNQGNTFICWSFATCSFLESEMARLKLPSVRLSVMYPPYCQYLEKARRFVQMKGESRFSPGDTFCGVLDACRDYGAMPASAYDGPPGGKSFNQREMYAELQGYMEEVKSRGQWDEVRVLAGVRKILNQHLGKPPETFTYDGKTHTPRSFLAEVVRLPWQDYVLVTSFESAPFNTFTELMIPDNWRHNSNFWNVPLPAYYNALQGALRAGFTAAVEMDNTEPSYLTTGRYCFIPDFDIPVRNINQAAREIRFVSEATTDDHAIHLIGWTKVRGEHWFLAKDSGKGAWRHGNQGCLFLNGPYVKLKVLGFIVHRDGVPSLAIPWVNDQPKGTN